MTASWEIREGDAFERLREMPDGSVQCCVTSPPYFGLRDFGHDGQIGLEATPDEFVARLVAVFREVRRVLRPDGTLWLNIGDSYVSGQGGRQTANGELPLNIRRDRPEPKARPELPNAPSGWAERAVSPRTYPGRETGLKPKDLYGMPWLLAFALRADGWYLRSDIIWAKANPMPESVTDRPTSAHEHVFLLAKSARYFYDADAIREEAAERTIADGREPFSRPGNGNLGAVEVGHPLPTPAAGRNKRNVWEIATQPYPDAHFATFPPKLVEPCILAGSAPGDTILDPFAGAGTTGLVALRRDRSFIGIELSPAYAEMARERIRGDAPLLNTPAEVAA